MTSVNETYGVLPNHMGGGPHGLGDPDDRTLRKVESDVLIPKQMKKEAHMICSDYVKAFSECGKKEGYWSVINCRKEVNEMNKCVGDEFSKPELRRRCTEAYLERRSEFRRTGLTMKEKMKRKESDVY